MADLTANDVTVTLNAEDMDYTSQGRIRAFPTIAFGDAAKTYPAGGIPLPAKNLLGMRLGTIFRFNIQPPADGYVYKYDATNHKLQMYYADYDAGADGALIEITGVAPAATTVLLDILGR